MPLFHDSLFKRCHDRRSALREDILEADAIGDLTILDFPDQSVLMRRVEAQVSSWVVRNHAAHVSEHKPVRHTTQARENQAR